MNTTRRRIVIPVLLVIFTFIFTILNNGLGNYQIDQIIQPLIFALTLIVCIFFLKLRKFILRISSILLILMLLTYLFNMLDISNWLGSLGFGMLFITVFSYLPQLIKNGSLEKF